MTALVCCKHALAKTNNPVCLECYKELAEQITDLTTRLAAATVDLDIERKLHQAASSDHVKAMELLTAVEQERNEYKQLAIQTAKNPEGLAKYEALEVRLSAAQGVIELARQAHQFLVSTHLGWVASGLAKKMEDALASLPPTTPREGTPS